MTIKIKWLRNFSFVFCLLSPFLIRIQWLTNFEVVFLCSIQALLLIFSEFKQFSTEKELSSFNPRLGRLIGRKRLKFFVMFSSILVFNAVLFSRNGELIWRKTTTDKGVFYIKKSDLDYSGDHYFTLYKFKILERDQQISSEKIIEADESEIWNQMIQKANLMD